MGKVNFLRTINKCGVWLNVGVLYDNQDKISYEVRIKEIIDTICYYFNTTPSSLNLKINKSRKTKFIIARFTCYYLIYHSTKLSLDNIGNIFGGYGHATILNGLRRCRERIETNVDYCNTIIQIVNDLSYVDSFTKQIIFNDINEHKSKFKKVIL